MKFTKLLCGNASLTLLLIFIAFVSTPAHAAVLYDYSTLNGTFTIGSQQPFTMYGASGSYAFSNPTLPLSTPVSYLKIAYPPGSSCATINSMFAFTSGGQVLWRGDFGDVSNPVDDGTTCTYPINTNRGWTDFKGFSINANTAPDNGKSFYLDSSAPSDLDLFNGNNGSNIINGSGLAFQLCDSGGCPTGGFQTSSFYYAPIKNATTTGYTNLWSGPSTSDSVIKTLPEDWIVNVGSTTNMGSSTIADGYDWYQVTDPTDGVKGWMEGSDASTTHFYLPYLPNQADLIASSSNYIATSSRPALIQEIVDHYYNDTSTTSSLYSSDSGASDISSLKDGGYPEKLIWGIAATESGGAGFDNENITSDFGHGIMQLTFEPGDFDNRGLSSKVTLPLCDAVSSNDYLDCYTDADSGSPHYRHYMQYQGNPSNPTYKQYSNTEQSIYANIKDGLSTLSNAYQLHSDISTSTVVDGLTLSADDRKNILATQHYNGSNSVACQYVDAVATRLDNIDTYFPAATSSDIAGLVSKMHTVGQDVVCADLHSPGNLSIQDLKGRQVGVVNGKGVNDFPLAVYDKNEKFVDILGAEDTGYKYVVQGTANATYGLDITLKNGDQELSFKARNIPTTPGEIHTYTVDKAALEEGKSDAVTVEVDKNGDGVIDTVIKVGSTLDQAQFLQTISMPSDLSSQPDVQSTEATSTLISSTNPPQTTDSMPETPTVVTDTESTTTISASQ